ncbi:MAG: diguanylate cyclase [Solirubrobacterales bacterium]|nr:diguanylate cyclase [Solirubrobacterales bacterium]MBV9837402.1 diguanylate cyclase [Solirubrobacterales bacterium]
MAATPDARPGPEPTLSEPPSLDVDPAPAGADHTARSDQAAHVFLADALLQLASLLDLEACAILIPEADELRPAAAIGLPDDWLAKAPEQDLPDGFESSWSVPLAVPDGRVLGLFVAYSSSPERPDEATLGTARAYGAGVALGLDRLHREAGAAARYQAVVLALSSALDARDEYSGGHTTETTGLALRVGRRLGLAPSELELVCQLALLHDVGKLGIPTDILHKQDDLEPDELSLVRQHPVIGERILSDVSGLAEIAAAIRCGHERWDGLGYPDGLAGEQIPLASRIVFACDAWHAMRSDRPYRPAISTAEAMAQLREGAGKEFDPRVAQALLEVLGDDRPPPACSPSESRDRALSWALAELAEELGAEDLFVFRKIAGTVYSHLGGIGRGAGWAGNIELDSGQERHFRAAIQGDAPLRVSLESAGRIVGPYYGRSAVIVPCGEETVVVFGSAAETLATAPIEDALRLADRARALVTGVSPTKQLADELEVLSAVREVTTVSAESMTDTLSAIAARARMALSAEFAAVATIPSGDVDQEIGISAEGWGPPDPDAAARALAKFGSRAADLPLLCQDMAAMPDAPEGFRHSDGASSLHVLPVGSPAVATMLIVHAEPGLRGFTALCQRVAGAMSDAAELVVRRAIAQERLRTENVRLTEKVRTDELTGVASRSAWEEALGAEELHRGRSGAPVSIVIVDVDELKAVNDELGHAAGDALLRRCAGVLADAVRATDLVARIGGDEFGVLLRYADAEEARSWCERLEERRQQEQPTPRWSIGFASAPPHSTVAAALDDADRRMYKRKLGGRSTRR